MFKSQSKYRIKSLILVLTSTNISVIIILQIKKAVAPTKETNRHQSKKKGKPIISQSAKWYKIMTVYRIKIAGTEYNEDYTFTEPAEDNVKEEVSAILEEMKKGNIDSLEVKREA